MQHLCKPHPHPIVMDFQPFINGLKSKGFALPLCGQRQFVSLKRTNQFLDFDVIKVLAFFNHYHFVTKAFRQWPKDLPYYFRILCFLPQMELVDNHLIKLCDPWPVFIGCWAKPTWMGGVVLLLLKMVVRLVIFSPLD